MGLSNSPDIFQEKMNELFEGFEYVRAYIDDLLIISNGTYKDHLHKIDTVLNKLKQTGLKVNATKSFFAKEELEYLFIENYTWLSSESDFESSESV